MTAGFTTGALRLAIGTYSKSASYGTTYPREQINTQYDANCWNRDKQYSQESGRYIAKNYYYINPNSITTIEESKQKKEPNGYVSCNTTIHTADGKEYTTSLSRETIIDCAQQALETGKVIDLIS